MEEDDGAGLDFGRHPLGDVRRGEILPVQAVPTGSGCKGALGLQFSHFVSMLLWRTDPPPLLLLVLPDIGFVFLAGSRGFGQGHSV